MKNLLTIILVSIFSLAFGQRTKPRTNYGPNIGLNIGGELRSNLSFIGPSKRGLNILTYESTPSYVIPIAGIGVDINRLSLDFRVSPQSDDLVNIKPQFNMNISFLFGKRK